MDDFVICMTFGREIYPSTCPICEILRPGCHAPHIYIDTVDLKGPHRDRFVQRVDESYSVYTVVQQGMLLFP